MSHVTPQKPNNAAIIQALFDLAPQFITEDADTLAMYNRIIDLLWCQVNWANVACCGIMIMVYLLAHTLTLRLNPSTGIVNSLKEGELAIGFAITSDTGILNSTSYGKAYEDLVKRKIIGVAVSNLPLNFYVYPGSCGPCGGYGGCC